MTRGQESFNRFNAAVKKLIEDVFMKLSVKQVFYRTMQRNVKVPVKHKENAEMFIKHHITHLICKYKSEEKVRRKWKDTK